MPGTVRTLRSYIAPAAPATRAPGTGAESPMRVEFGFTPRWFRARCGIDFSERWHLDPVYRGETLTRMRRELRRVFPGIPFSGVGDDAPCMTLDGVHGATFVAQLFDIPCRYFIDNWPAAEHAFLTPRRIAALQPVSLEDTAVGHNLFEQIDLIARECGVVSGYLNWQGVLNTAFRLRGADIFADLLGDPPLARHLFDIIAETMIQGMRTLYARQRETGFVVEHATVSNCVVNMISPDLYAEHLLPYDARIAEAFPVFGIHNCAWNVDPYIRHYASIPNLGYVDMGIESDFPRARALCPHARRAVMYTPTDLAAKPLEALRADLVRIRTELSPCDIVMADIDDGTLDERVRDFAKLADETLAIPVE